MATASPQVLLQAPIAGAIQWLALDSAAEVLRASTHSEVRTVLERAETAAASGLTAAGFVSYEAAPAFDAALRVRSSADCPLAWFGIFEQRRVLKAPPTTGALAGPLHWQPSISRDGYRRAVATIHDQIARGETYQVNFTWRFLSRPEGDPLALFAALCQGQQSRCCAFVDTGDWVVCSASPELFFRLEGGRIWSRPMKGTAPRGRTAEEDLHQGEWLQRSEKNRAENLMIVDMVRNDLGRIAAPETVTVTRLWTLEKYPSLFQLTSQVEADTEAPLFDIFAALFPCASVTGAPKVRAMQIIAELEDRPRRVYTGAIGVIGPGRRARFNVAIRTALIDQRSRRLEYGTGGGIVWDSIADDEWQECRTKALVLDPPMPEFELLETLRWDPTTGFFLLQRHLDRLRSSAAYFDYSFDAEVTRRALRRLARDLPRRPHRVRLRIEADGSIALDAEPLADSARPWRVALSTDPIDRRERFLYHKTTHRSAYDEHRSRFPHHDDVLLWNQDGEVTESTLANVVVRRHGHLVTPPVDCGLLAGTFRAQLLADGKILEHRILIDDLCRSEEVFLINSVRGWLPAQLDTRTLSRAHADSEA